MINRALDTSKQGAHMARFKAEVADKEIARLKDELEYSRRRERESFEKEVNHTYRRGKREIVEVMKSHCDKFSQSFGELKGCYKAFADYRKCRGTVGGLYLTQLPDYSFSSEYAMHSGLMAEKDKDSKFSEVEEEIWKQWEPVPVSPEMGAFDETGEVNQPVAPLDVNDYSIGRSILASDCKARCELFEEVSPRLCKLFLLVVRVLAQYGLVFNVTGLAE